MNVVILQGCLSSAPVPRTLPSGDELLAFEVTTRPADGGRAESVPVTWLRPPRRAAAIASGTEVVVTGRVRRRYFSAGGTTASRTEVVADAVVPVRQRARAAALVDAARVAVGAGSALGTGPAPPPGAPDGAEG